ncbi:membrane protein insertase YidC [Patescibacteria group bacterium]|nr:membrane protein insertase YidC [Patescibacteria group bacterium]
MNPFKLLAVELIYRPIFNLLVILLAAFAGNLGRAIVVLTLIIRALLWKVSSNQAQMQKGMGNMQEKLKEVQDKYANDPTKLSQETMKVMKSDGLAPLKGCMSLLVQIPVFFGLLYVIRAFAGAEGTMLDPNDIYSFVAPFAAHYLNPDAIQHRFFGIDLLVGKNMILTVVGAIFVYIQSKLISLNQTKPAAPAVAPGGKAMPDMSKMMGFMNIFMAFMMGSFIYGTPSGVGIYLITTTLFTIVQYLIQNRQLVKIKWETRNVKNKPQVINHKH